MNRISKRLKRANYIFDKITKDDLAHLAGETLKHELNWYNMTMHKGTKIVKVEKGFHGFDITFEIEGTNNLELCDVQLNLSDNGNLVDDDGTIFA